jgi:putative ABC transport system permease protein
MDSILQDLRFAWRMIAKQKGFSAVVILTLGLGIGVNTAILSIVNAVLIRPLPYPDPDQLVQVQKRWQPPWLKEPEVTTGLRGPEVVAWQEENHAFSEVAGYTWRMATLSGEQEAERARCGMVSPSFLTALRAPFVLGRGFLPGERRSEASPVVVLGYGLWKRRFGGEGNILGRSISVDQVPHTVVGVLGAGFRFPEPYDFCVPLRLDDDQGFVGVIGRLMPGVTPEQGCAALDTIYKRVSDPKENGTILLTTVHAHIVEVARRKILIFLAGAVCVLLIACVNVANLLLARSASRQREMAIRTAVGAGRMRIIRQLLTESVLLAVMGAVLGLILAFWTRGFVLACFDGLPALSEVSMDGRVMGLSFVIALITGLLFGLAPALDASRLGSSAAMKLTEGGSRSHSPLRSHLSGALVISEMALSLVLLLGAGLLSRSFVKLNGVDPGFRPDHILTFALEPSKPRYPDAQARAAYFERVVERLRELPGIEAIGADASLPLTGYTTGIKGMTIEGQVDTPDELDWFMLSIVSSDYLRVMGIPIKRGRGLTERDVAGAPKVALVNDSFVRRFYAGAEALGKQLGGSDGLEIVGIVGDVRQHLKGQMEPRAYVSYLQFPEAWGRERGLDRLNLVIRSHGDPMSLATPVRDCVRSVDKDQPVEDLMTLEQRRSDSLVPARLNMILAGAIAVLALVLAAVGIYGVLAHSVARRTREIGIRMALGAESWDVIGSIISMGLRRALVGIVVGLAAGIALTRFLGSLLFGVDALDAPSFGGAAMILILVAVAACYFPAAKAAKVDPMLALRHE